MVHQDEISAANDRASMTVAAIVEHWSRELTDGDVRELLRVVLQVVEKDPGCIEKIQGFDVRVFHDSPFGALESARNWLRDSPTATDAERLRNAHMVTLDVRPVVAQLRLRRIAVPGCLGGTPREDAPRWVSPDYRRVRWYGTEYRFNEVQARVIEALWYDLESGGAGLSESWLLDVVEPFYGDRKNPRLKDSFGGGSKERQHPAWGTMIRRVAMKTYALVKPTD